MHTLIRMGMAQTAWWCGSLKLSLSLVRGCRIGLLATAVLGGVAACTADWHRIKADDVAVRIIAAKQQAALGRTEPFTIQTPADTLRRRLLAAQQLPITGPASVGTDQLDPIDHWPQRRDPRRERNSSSPIAPWQASETLRLSLFESLQVGARNSRAYQAQKESVFRAALDLDLELNKYRNTYTGLLSSLLSTDQSSGDSITGLDNSAETSVSRRLKSGTVLAGRLIIDLAKLLSSDRSSSLGVFADATIAIPLLRGAGKHIVTEPLTQAQRDVLYAIWLFERFKKLFAVDVASQYLSVLQQQDQVDNAADNYKRLIRSSHRARRLNEAGRLEKVQVDQALQDELGARDNWVRASEAYERALDGFKITLGLPTDARIELDGLELDRLATAAQKVLGDTKATVGEHRVLLDDERIELQPPLRQGGPLEMDQRKAIRMAFNQRLDLRALQGRVHDAERGVVVAADALKVGVKLMGTAMAGERRTLGSTREPDAQLRPEHGFYSAGIDLDLPWDRTAERNTYRDSFITLERAVRELQEQEDVIKLEVRDRLGGLVQARESYTIQARAVVLAQQRVRSTELFLEQGQVLIRDALEAKADLLNARNALTAALVDYRVAELELQRDTGTLQVDTRGIWREFEPGDNS